MSRKIRKVIALAMASMMLISSASILSACSSGKGDSRPVVADEAEWYDLTKFDLECPFDTSEVSSISYNSPIYLNGYIYVLLTGEKVFNINEATTDSDFDYNQYIINSICKYDTDGNYIETINIENTTGDDLMQAQKISEENGMLKVSCLSAGADDAQELNNQYVIIDPETGDVVETYSSPEFSSDMVIIENEISAGDKTLYSLYDFSGDNVIYNLVITSDGEILNDIKVNDVLGVSFWDISNFVVVDDSTVVMTAFGDDGITTLNLNLDDGRLTMSNGYNEMSSYYFTTTQNGLSCAVNSEGVWTVNSDLTVDKYFDFSNSLINSSDAARSTVTYYDEDTIVLFYSSYSSSMFPDSKIFILRKAETNPNAGKKILSIYSLISDISYSEAEAISAFNAENEEYFAVLSFADEDMAALDGDAYDYVSSISDQLMVDLLAGDGPDVVLNGAGVQQLNNPEFFVDLNTFVNGSNGLDRNQYYSSILDAAQSSDGALYQIPVTFGVEGILAGKDDVGEGRVGFTYAQYTEFVDSICNGQAPIADDKLTFLTEALASGNMSYINDGTVNFDNEEFRALVAFADEYILEAPDFEEEGGISYFGGFDALSSGAADYELTRPQDFVFYAADADGALGLYGRPFSSEVGPCAEIYSSAAISAMAGEEVQNAAWGFIKAMLSENVQVYESNGIPMNISANNALINDALSLYNEQYYLLVNMGLNEMMISMYGLKLADESIAENYLDICAGVGSVKAADTSVAVIVMEEMGAYFSGQKSLDQVIEVLNDRAQTIVNERASF